MTKQKIALLLAVPALAVAAGALSLRQSPKSSAQLTTTYVPKLVTNEYAYYNPDDTHAVRSADWDVTSGSLFAVSDYLWTGKPDSCQPNVTSSNCTNSNVFRANSKKKYGNNSKLNLSIRLNQDIRKSTCGTTGTCWYGVHMWLGYQSEFNLYYASISRADGSMVIKRKIPCGTDNSGTYVVISPYVVHPATAHEWNNYTITIHNDADGGVTIAVYDIRQSVTHPVITGVDHGGTNPKWTPACTTPGHYPTAAYPPLTQGGTVGVRGDFTDFNFTAPKVTAQ